MSARTDRLCVAVAAIVGPQGKILMTQRRDNVHQGGKWEFPGGKVETGESVEHALARELREEIGIVPLSPTPLIRVHHDYSDRALLLDTWLVQAWRGEIEALEGQPMRWVEPAELSRLALPPANQPIVEALQLRLRSK